MSTITTTTTTTTTRKSASIMNLASLVTSYGPDSPPIPRLQTTASAPAVTPKSHSRTYDQYRERKTPTSPYSSTTFGMSATFASSISPRMPLSPPAEERRKWSLPSISSLLEGAAADASLPSAKRLRLSPEPRAPLQSTDQNVMNGSRTVLPPTPPLRPGSGFSETKRSSTAPSSPDSAISPTSITSSSNPIKNPESFHRQQQQQSQPQSQSPTLASLVSTTSAVPAERASASQDSHTQSRFSGPQYPSPAPTISSYASPVEPSPSPVVYYQRPAASTFQAANNAPASVSPSTSSQLISPVNPAWQHHHYFPTSASPPYPQNHDRYVCRTCHKAFSRPSSLRIHSHSHTGEKPFRCTHVGCGKAFSVRSNMKRHERGCHTGRPVAATLV